jgi:hypothetical protein
MQFKSILAQTLIFFAEEKTASWMKGCPAHKITTTSKE